MREAKKTFNQLTKDLKILKDRLLKIEKDIDDKLHWYDDSPMKPSDKYIELNPVIADWWKENIGPLGG